MDNTPVTTGEMLRRMQNGWDDLQAYINSLTTEQLTQPTDAAGWRVQDHLMHLAVWEGGVAALINGQSRQAYMGVSDAAWQSDWHADHFFTINNEIFQRNKAKSLDDVRADSRKAHEQMVNAVSAMSDADLLRPYNSLDPASDSTTPLWKLIVGDSFGHYAEHRPWMEAIVAGNQ